MKIAIATCNRADYSKLAPIMEGLKNDPFFEVSGLFHHHIRPPHF